MVLSSVESMQTAQLVTVMIASPADVAKARDAVLKSLHAWNDANARNRNTVLLPLMWESSAVPQLGADAQSVINSQLVDQADVVIALFGTRLGQGTPRALSGTAEEMTRASEAGKPVHSYFSTADMPADVDLDQVQRLREFKKDLGGLYTEFANIEQLRTLVWQAIEFDLAALGGDRPGPKQPSPGVDFLVQSASERVPETDSKGNLKYKTHRWVELTNRGDLDAEQVEVEPVEGLHFWLHWPGPTTIQHGQMRKVPITYSMATSRAAIVVKWVENGGEKKTREFDID